MGFRDDIDENQLFNDNLHKTERLIIDGKKPEGFEDEKFISKPDFVDDTGVAIDIICSHQSLNIGDKIISLYLESTKGLKNENT